MYWFLLSLMCAFFSASQAAYGKKLAMRGQHMLIAWVVFFFSTPFFGAYLIFKKVPFPEISPRFLLLLLAVVLLNILANTLYFKALKVGQLSRDLPLLSLSPIFMMLTTYLMVGQKITPLGAVAIVVMVIGSFVLQRENGSSIKVMALALWRVAGTRLMLMVALIWSISANMDKLCINEVGSLWYPFLFSLSFGIVFLPLLLYKKVPIWSETRIYWKQFLMLGLINALAILPQMLAVEVAPHVAYVVSIKRGGYLLFGIIFGAVFFKERNLGWRIFGAAWIIVGLVILSLNAISG